MNPPVNERFVSALAANGTRKSELIAAQARELLNLRRLPAMLNISQTAVLLNVGEHDIPVLVRKGLLKPLGHPKPNAVKYFAAVAVLEMAADIQFLSRVRDVIYQYWQGKNTAKPDECDSRNGR